MSAPNFNPKVDAYLAKVRPFAQPIMFHLRELVHQACPEVQETIKWSRPFFEYRGAILGNMSAFKEHCSFGFWGEEIAAVLRQAKVVQEEGMGTLGRITKVSDLPPDAKMLAWLRQAAAFVDRGEYTSPIAARHKVVKAKKPALKMPPDFAKALQQNKKSRRRLRRVQLQRATRIPRVDHRCHAPGDPRPAHRHRRRMDRARQTTPLEISKLRIAAALPLQASAIRMRRSRKLFPVGPVINASPSRAK